MTIGAVVVNHNAGESLANCVASLRDAGIDDIVIVDNASSDDSIELAQQRDSKVRIVFSDRNVGYGSGVNIGRRELVCDYLFVCNPDLVVESRAPMLLAAYLDEHPRVAVVGPKIFATSGEVYPSARSFPNIVDALGHGLFAMFWPQNPFSRRYKLQALGVSSARQVDWVSGACFLVATQAFDSVDGFDERYFMYVEDLDLCWRLHQSNFAVAYEPTATVVHHGGVSSGRRPFRMLVAHHASTWRFARRRLTGWKSVLLPFVGLGIVARLAVALARQMGRR